MKALGLAIAMLAALLTDHAHGAAKPIVEDHWVAAGKTLYITLILEGGQRRLLIVEGDGTSVEYCLMDPAGKTVRCAKGYLQIEMPVTAGEAGYTLRVVNDGRIAGNFRIIAI